MSRLLITVNGKQYDVEVEVIEDSIVETSMTPTTLVPSQNSVQPKAKSHSSAPKSRVPKKQVQQNSAVSTDGIDSPINGVVLEIPAKVGSAIKEGDIVMILEAMKMKTNIFAPCDCTIGEILVNLGDNIEAGQKLIKFA